MSNSRSNKAWRQKYGNPSPDMAARYEELYRSLDIVAAWSRRRDIEEVRALYKQCHYNFAEMAVVVNAREADLISCQQNSTEVEAM